VLRIHDFIVGFEINAKLWYIVKTIYDKPFYGTWVSTYEIIWCFADKDSDQHSSEQARALH
jgi:hypothetical protein